ncbi:hypothetical protein BJ912DRAFT_1024512 [Pholiota molesta]|nr:hypothetical protein BJ912DRAFT_1024512 [Pholiota molesta]
MPHHNQLKQSVLARTAISLEYASLINTGHCPLGIYVVPSTSSLFVWDAVFFVHRVRYYADSILKFRLTFPANYPTAKGTPRFDILHWVKVAFKKHALDNFQESDCFNKEAFGIYRESTQSFAALATQSASLSQSESALFDADHPSPLGNNVSSEIVFRKLKPEQLAREREKLGLEEWDNNKKS